MKTILLAEHDPILCRSMEKVLVTNNYKFLYSKNYDEIIDYFESSTIDSIIVDLRLPSTDSYDLLKVVKEKYPTTLRIALSDYSDNKLLYSTVDNNLARIFLYKPWKDQELLHFLEGIFVMENQLKDDSLLSLIKSIDNLPTLPAMYLEISKMVEEHQSVFDITKVIEKDQAIASRILKIANSAFYCAKTGDIKQAIMFIGLTNVKNIILTQTVYGSHPENKRLLGIEWEHSAMTNKILNVSFEEFIDYKLQNTYKSAGLLHNIGKAIIATNFQVIFSQLSEASEIPCHKREEELLQTNHQKLGGYLLNWWDLPYPIIEAALYHHDPMNKNIINRDLVQMVHLASYYSWKILNQTPREKLVYEVFDDLNVKQEHYEAFIEAYMNNPL